jgi:hypothetical protein
MHRMIRPLALVATTAATLATAGSALAAGNVTALKGDRTGDGCTFKGKLELAANKKSVEVREVSYDPITCTLRVKQTVSAGTVAPKASAAKVGAAAVWYRSAGQQKSWFVNQNTITETQVVDKIDYLYNGGKVSNGVCATTRSKVSFWAILANSRVCQYQNFQSVAHGASYTKFGTTGFCPNHLATYTEIENHIYGKANGSLISTYDYARSGACTSSLFFRQRLIRLI